MRYDAMIILTIYGSLACSNWHSQKCIALCIVDFVFENKGDL